MFDREKSIVDKIIGEVSKFGAEKKFGPKPKGVMVVEKQVIGMKPKADPSAAIEAAEGEQEGEEGKDWKHSETSESPEAEALEKKAGLHMKPSWEKYEDSNPDWMGDEAIVKKVMEELKKRRGITE